MKSILFCILLQLTIVSISLADSVGKEKNSHVTRPLSKSRGERKNVLTSDKNTFDWNNLLSAVIGGAIGLIPTVINSLKRTKIKGKIISQYATLGKEGAVCVSLFLHKVSLFVENRNFYLKKI